MTTILKTLSDALDALGMQQTGLQWYRGMMPEYVDGSDAEADTQVESVMSRLAALTAEMEAQQAQEPVAHATVESLRPDECQRRVSVKWVGQPVAGPLYAAPVQPVEQPDKRPQNCGSGFCSCIECVLDDVEQPADSGTGAKP